MTYLPHPASRSTATWPCSRLEGLRTTVRETVGKVLAAEAGQSLSGDAAQELIRTAGKGTRLWSELAEKAGEKHPGARRCLANGSRELISDPRSTPSCSLRVESM
jgi:hypothetical protein